MTTIIDSSVPSIGASDAMLDRETSTSRLIVFAGAAAVVVTALNFAAAVYFYRGIGELRTVERQLEQLSEFEGRIIAKVDKVNTGVQSRFEALDGNLQGRLAEIRERLEKIENQVPSREEASMLPSAEAMPADVEPQVIPLDETPPTLEAAAEPLATPPPSRRASMPSPSAAYQRLENAEGKVYYRKVK
ncbi:hypothetical protein [Aminobacter aminovorans]|uniref:hypothetical protein n=1 Tax=Aminobacter TaxID=31988 RepID=UPI0028575F0B|nr:hypothetical protein [Aminobacter aminovorans]MDR7222285.1 hypothetical protein [Aminobacter aminovorans]